MSGGGSPKRGICVYCGSSLGADPRYAEAADQLGAAIASMGARLVFGGGADGIFAAYDAKTGTKLWSIDLKTGILAPPVSYAIDGQAKISGLAYLFSHARGASSGHGSIVENRIAPAAFATIASNSAMTRTIGSVLLARMWTHRSSHSSRSPSRRSSRAPGNPAAIRSQRAETSTGPAAGSAGRSVW